jgi:hypothetical protein
MAKTMTADDEDNEVDGDGRRCDGRIWRRGRLWRWATTTTTMATARRATKLTMMVTAQR